MVDRKLIVGVDPGGTLGLAVLDLEGKPVLVDSYRGKPKAEIIAIISSKGDPAIIAVDVQKPSQLAEYLAAKFDAQIFHLPTPISTGEKLELARDYASRFCPRLPDDQHQSDALVAAVKALNFYQDKFRRVDARIKQFGIRVSADKAKELVIDGFSVAESIRVCLEQKRQKPKLPPAQTVNLPPQRIDEVMLLLRRKIRSQNLIISNLRRLCERKEREVRIISERNELLESRISQINTEQHLQLRTEYEYSRLKLELQRQKDRVQRLVEELDQLRPQTRAKLSEMSQSGDVEILKIIPSFTEEEIERTSKTMGIRPGDIVLLRDASGGGKATARRLIERNIKAVLASSKLSHLAFEALVESGIPVIASASVPIQWSDDAAYVKNSELDKAIFAFNRMQVLEKERELEALFSEYRTGKP